MVNNLKYLTLVSITYNIFFQQLLKVRPNYMDADYKMAKEGLQNIQIDTVLPRM